MSTIVFVDLFIICLINYIMSSYIDWMDVIKKEARGLDDADFGEVQEVSNGLVLTQRGIVNRELFSIPQSLVESYDGKVLKFNISEMEAVNKYKKLFEPKPTDAAIDSDTKLDKVSTIDDSNKVDGVIDDVVDDTIKDALIQPTREEAELQVEKEVAILNKESSVDNEHIHSTLLEEQIPSENTLEPKTEKKEKSSKPVTEEKEEEIPLKKEEAGIA